MDSDPLGSILLHENYAADTLNDIGNTDFHLTLNKRFKSGLCNFDRPDAHIVVQAQIL